MKNREKSNNLPHVTIWQGRADDDRPQHSWAPDLRLQNYSCMNCMWKVGVADVARHAPATVGVYMIDKECCPKQVPLKGESKRIALGLHQSLVPI